MFIVVISPMLNGEQSIDYYDTYDEALKGATSGDRIYIFVEEVSYEHT